MYTSRISSETRWYTIVEGGHVRSRLLAMSSWGPAYEELQELGLETNLSAASYAHAQKHVIQAPLQLNTGRHGKKDEDDEEKLLALIHFK